MAAKQMLALAYLNELPFANKLELAHSSLEESTCKPWHGPVA